MIPPPAYVYLLQSLNGARFYLGWTTDIERRLAEHNLGKSSYTKNRGPWRIVGYEMYRNHHEAKKRERTLKGCPRMLTLFKKRLLSLEETSDHKQVVG